MGLTLHYQGKIKDIGQIAVLQQEVQDICETMNWKYRTDAIVFDLPPAVMQQIGMAEYDKVILNGVNFCPHPKSESVNLYFNQQGKLANLLTLNFADTNTDPVAAFSCFTKTQFAGPEIHIAIVKLLKYLDKKYELSIHSEDEGEYWDTLDESRLNNNFERNEVLQDMVMHALEGIELTPTMDPAEILKQIDNYLKRIGEKN